MPIQKTNGGYKYGAHGHVYPTREGAVKQAQAIHASGYKEPAKASHTHHSHKTHNIAK